MYKYLSLKRRCNCPSQYGYKWYGKKGIKVEWDTYQDFKNDMYESYAEGLTLDRKDVNGSYCKENCAWVSKQEQAKNKRRYSNNTVGHTCISFFLNKGVTSLRARVQDPKTGKRKAKILSLRKYTKEVAIEILVKWVKEQHISFGYGESHGS